MIHSVIKAARMLPRSWTEALLILLLSGVGLGISQHLHPPAHLLPPPPGTSRIEPTPVSPELARGLIEAGQVLPVDARPREAWTAGHLPGAISLPLMEALDPGFQWPPIPGDLPLLVYCSGPTCFDARDLCPLLAERGHTRLLLFEGGWEAWNNPSRGEQP